MTTSAFLGVQILGAQPYHDAKGQCRMADTITICNSDRNPADLWPQWAQHVAVSVVRRQYF
jgi:hypothetical protein